MVRYGYKAMSMAPKSPPNAQDPHLPDVELPPIRWRVWIWSATAIFGFAIFSVMPIGRTWDNFRTRGGHGREIVRAINNMRQLGLALMEFETEYGAFPDEATISKVRTNNPASTISLGNATANDYFRQLLASENAATETIFSGYPAHRPDDNFDGTKALEKGECSFAYIKGVAANHPAAIPIVVYPLVKGKLVFDYKLCKEWGKKVAILRTDCSVITLPVDKSGHVYLNGKDLFDPSQPFWGGKVPDVKWPE